MILALTVFYMEVRMRKLMVLVAALLLAVTVFAAGPAAAIIPTCYSNLPKSSYPASSWTYSHQCREGTTIWYVYIDTKGGWHLVSSTVMP